MPHKIRLEPIAAHGPPTGLDLYANPAFPRVIAAA